MSNLIGYHRKRWWHFAAINISPSSHLERYLVATFKSPWLLIFFSPYYTWRGPRNTTASAVDWQECSPKPISVSTVNYFSKQLVRFSLCHDWFTSCFLLQHCGTDTTKSHWTLFGFQQCVGTMHSDRGVPRCLPEPVCLSRGLHEWLIQCFTLTSITLHMVTHNNSTLYVNKPIVCTTTRLLNTMNITLTHWQSFETTEKQLQLSYAVHKHYYKLGWNWKEKVVQFPWHTKTQSISLSPFLFMHLHFSSYSPLTCRGHSSDIPFPQHAFPFFFVIILCNLVEYLLYWFETRVFQWKLFK